MTNANNPFETMDEASFLARWPKTREIETPSLHPGSAQPSELMTAEEIARTLKAMQEMIPPDADSDLHSVTEAVIKERKAREKAEFYEYAEKLKKIWD